MRKSIKWVMAAGVASTFTAVAQNSQQSESERSAGDEQSQQSTAERSSAPAPPKQRRPAPSSFTPSERIRADTSVAFPADI